MDPTAQIVLASTAFGVVLGSIVNGVFKLFADHHDRVNKRKDFLLSAAKDITLKEYDVQVDKFKIAPSMDVLIVAHYNALKHLVDTDGDIHPDTLRGYQESMKDPTVIAQLRNIKAHGGSV